MSIVATLISCRTDAHPLIAVSRAACRILEMPYRGSRDCRTRPAIIDRVEALAATDGTVRWF